MIQTLTRNWLLLVVCGILDATMAAIYLIMWDTAGPVTFYSWNGTVVLLGKLALAAGFCAIAAGVWKSASGKCWPLVLHGVALGALGLIQYGLTGFRISLLTVALLVVVIAASMELTLVQALGRQRHAADRWFLALAGVALGSFVLAFLALGLRWIEIGPGSHVDLLWLGSYFGFSAICMLGLALRLYGHYRSRSGREEASPPLGNPRHAH